MLERGTGPVQLVYKADARNFRLIGIAPVGFRLRFYTSHAVKNNDSTVEHAEGSFHFHSKINVPRSIDNIKTVLLGFVGRSVGRSPKAGNCCCSNSYSSFSPLFHPVGRCLTFMNLANLVLHAGIEKYAFGRRRLTCINVRDNSKISNFF